MNIVTNNKWIGQSTIRPDGVDKVTGRAAFAADTNMPGMIWGKVLRSPHPHARIKSIDTSKAEKLPGVKAVVTARDIVDFTIEKGAVMLGIQDMRWMCRNVMAREKALFPGHPIAAVAATTEAIAAKACELIEVDYEVLPFAIEIDDAIKPDAPILHEFNKFEGKPSNIAGKQEVKKGDIAEGFKQADVVIERSFTTRPVHQGYIEPHACLVSVAADGKTTIWSSSQGQFMVRAMTAYLAGMPQSDIRAIPAEIGGGFGGKTIVYLEPLATILSKKSGRPVKMVMTREEVMRATGPTSGSKSTVKIGAKKDGTIVAAQGTFYLQAGALPGSPIRGAVGCSFSPYDIPHVLSTGFDVVSNRSKVAAYRAPGAPIGVSSSLAWLMPFVDEEKIITVGTWRAISAASCSGPGRERMVAARDRLAGPARVGDQALVERNAMDAPDRLPLDRAVALGLLAASSARVAQLGQQGREHAGVEVPLIEQERGLARDRRDHAGRGRAAPPVVETPPWRDGRGVAHREREARRRQERVAPVRLSASSPRMCGLPAEDHAVALDADGPEHGAHR